MKEELKIKIVQFFEYKWLADKNQSIDDEEEKAILDELPIEVQDRLYTGFLFNEFMVKFKGYFLIQKGNIHNFTNDKSVPYREYYSIKDN